MMAVRFFCDGCQHVQIQPACDLDLYVPPVELDGVLGAYFTFPCDCCGPREESVAEDIVTKLMLAGVVCHVMDIPKEAMEKHEGPPIGWDDLIELHEALARM